GWGDRGGVGGVVRGAGAGGPGRGGAAPVAGAPRRRRTRMVSPPVPKYLIVNADDLGAGSGVNRGILEAHRRGIVTSASLMVDAAGSEEGARLGRSARRRGLGLHVDLGAHFSNGQGAGERGANGHGSLRLELTRQMGRFIELTGRPPSHIDSHRDVHRDPGLLAAFIELARRWSIP